MNKCSNILDKNVEFIYCNRKEEKCICTNVGSLVDLGDK